MKKLLCLLPLLALSAFAAAPPPDNDDFAARTGLVSSGSISVQGRNASATTQASEPTIAGDAVSRSVWWEWTAPFTGPVIVTTAGSSFDTLLGVFTGTALGALTSIAENDDAGTGAYTSTVNFNAVSGIPYVILVGGYNGAGGKIRLGITVGTGPCTYTVTPTSKSFSNIASNGTETVTTTTGCSWSAVSDDAFITITSGSTGTGSGTLTYSVLANTALTARTGTMTIAGTTITISQAAAPACTYSLFPLSTNAPPDSVTNTVYMTAGTGCTWNATPNGSWITISSGASGTGSGSIAYVLQANTNSNQRIGSITAAGQTFTVTQAGTVPCTYSISPRSGAFTSTGGSSNIVVSTITDCAWTASSPVTWVTFSSTNGTGNGTVTYTVAANTNTVSRSTTLTVAGSPYAVSQTGSACSYSILPSSISVSATNSSSTVTVAAGTGCAWTAVANVSWLTITAGTSGNGSGSVVFNIAANLNTVTRAGTLTIAGQTFTVNQAAAACIYTITPTAAHYLAAGGPGSIAVTAGTGCAWTAVSGAAWLTVDSGTPGSGNGTVGYTVAANATTVSRTGTITVAGSTFTVTQDGTVSCAYSISPTSASYTSLGGTNSVAVTANAGCTWSVSSGATWLTFTPSSGSGNGTVTYAVAANTSSLTRTGTLTVAGQTFTVTQTGVACTYGIAPTSATYAATGGSGTVAVTATQGCNWTSSSDSPWLVVTSGSSGTGNGSVGYSVGAATNSVTRTGRLTIATKLLIVTQTGIPCTYSISPTSASFTDSAGGGEIAITASDNACTWTATSGASWMTVAPASGSGNGSVSYTVSATALAATRTGTLTVAGQTFTVTQTGDTALPVISLTAPANGSTVSNIITLTATATDANMARVEFYRDSGVLLGNDITSPYSLPYNTTNAANGAHTFYARAFDVAGNQGFSGTNAVTISNAAPSSTNTWAFGYGGTSNDRGLAAAIDASSNTVVTGYFIGNASFGGASLTGAGATDIFVAKYAPNGSFIWSKGFGGTGQDAGRGVAFDSSGDVIVTGYFNNMITFGASNYTASAQSDIFLIKLAAASGTVVWSKKFGGTGADFGYGVAVDTNNNDIVICGQFEGPVNFDAGTVLSTSASVDSFIARYSTLGTYKWVKHPNNGSTDTGNSVAVDNTGNAWLTGQFLGNINFGGTTLPQTGTGVAEDLYLVKLDSLGAHLWSTNFGGTSYDRGLGVAVDSSGNVAMTGSFTGSINFGGGVLSGAGQNAFVAAFTGSTGAHRWSKAFTHPVGALNQGSGVAVDSAGNVIVTGWFDQSCNFGSGTLTSAGSVDIFVVKYSSTGIFAWAKSAGGSNYDAGDAVAIDLSGYPVVTGVFSSNGIFNGTPLVSAGGFEMFMMKLPP